MKKRFFGIYVEIGNLCNLKCSFCSPTKRAPRRMSAEEFASLLPKIAPFTDNVYLHVLGEPMCHPELDVMLKELSRFDMKASITTNGTLLKSRGDIILNNAASVHRVSISLHSLEANCGADISAAEYISSSLEFAKRASELGIYTVFRLWNLDGDKNTMNSDIISEIYEAFPPPHEKRYTGLRLAKNVFLEYASVFTWPKDSAAEPVLEGTCHGLSAHVAILVDGSVVPCCLDSDGDMVLGNIFEQELTDILSGERAMAMKRGFECRKYVEPLCQRCTYARRFK